MHLDISVSPQVDDPIGLHEMKPGDFGVIVNTGSTGVTVGEVFCCKSVQGDPVLFSLGSGRFFCFASSADRCVKVRLLQRGQSITITAK